MLLMECSLAPCRLDADGRVALCLGKRTPAGPMPALSRARPPRLGRLSGLAPQPSICCGHCMMLELLVTATISKPRSRLLPTTGHSGKQTQDS